MINKSVSYEQLQAQIQKLEKELIELKSLLPETHVVECHERFRPFFNSAEKVVGSYFKQLELQPEKGTIAIGGQRYILVRASSLSTDFFESIRKLYKDKSVDEAFTIAKQFLFDVGHLIGIEDAKEMHAHLKLTDPLEKLSAGPVHFAHTGWSFVDVLEESSPSPDEHFFLKYNHPYSFEADAWIRAGKKSHQPVCVMNAAYSSGWCSESYGIPLTAVEITCRAKGDEHCTFIMAHPSKIEEHLDEVKTHLTNSNTIQIPFFFERKAAEEKALKDSELLRAAQQLSQMGSWEFDLVTRELLWSDELYNIFEVPKNTPVEEMYRVYRSRIADEDQDRLDYFVKRAVEFGERYTINHVIKLPDGKTKWLIGSGVPVKNDQGEVYKLLGYAQDVTQRMRTEIELNNFFFLSNDLLCLANYDGYFLKLSKAWEKVLGYSVEELTAQPFVNFIVPEDVERTDNEMQKLFQGIPVLGFTNRYQCKNGEIRYLRWNGSPDTNTSLIYCVVRDVTDEISAEKRLKDALHEKEVLLKEVHHRVKNNMQIISSLLNLQAGQVDDKNVQQLYAESQRRIKSIAAVHELLYQSGDLRIIDFGEYINLLLPDIVYAHNGMHNNVMIDCSVQAALNIDTSIPLGLLINEIVSNAFKYGLNNTTEDKLYIRLNPNASAEGQYILEIGDNGEGFNFSQTLASSETLGLMLIQELTGQLNGKLTQDFSQKGMHYRIEFKLRWVLKILFFQLFQA
jgi:PAS domain S-box-containing protein